MKYLSDQDVKERLSMDKCIDLMRSLFMNIAEGGASHKLRTVMPIEQNKLLGIMPGYLPYNERVGAKIITVYHENYKYGRPSHQGIVVVFDAKTGEVKGLVDGMSITAIRTAAVSAVATDVLAKKEASSLGLIGAGVQAAAHLEALSLVRDIKTAKIWCHDYEESQRFVAREAPKYDFPVHICDTAEEAVLDTQIVCTVTSSKTPVLENVDFGAHINAVGACLAQDRELSSTLVAKARLYGDSVQSVINESGDYLYPLKEGLIKKEHLLGELGDVLVGKLPGRTSDKDITLFKSLGLAVEDIVCASWLLDCAL